MATEAEMSDVAMSQGIPGATRGFSTGASGGGTAQRFRPSDAYVRPRARERWEDTLLLCEAIQE